MRQSQLFTKTRKEAPSDEVSKNAQLLLKAGFVYKEMAGAYDYLPLGLRVFNNIERIIREEMNAIGGQEVVLTALQQKETWEPTNQWDDAQVDVWFKTQLKNGTELGLAVTHEAPLTKLMKDSISSYRDLPQYVYQFQTKFRNETRAKSGIMRCREFVMKDLYSFSKDEAEHKVFYEKTTQAYKNVFNRIGLGGVTYLTYASGGMFSKFSHEFQTLTDAGEDTIYISAEDFGKGLDMKEGRAAINKEIYTDELKKDLGMDGGFEEKKAVEVGNIFTLGTRFSDALGLTYKTESGEEKSVFMGSYGIGPGRLIGTIVEVLADDKGIIWPKEVAPFQVHLLSLGNTPETISAANELYETLQKKNIDVLYDDRDLRPGEKFADSDLIGIPVRFVVSDKTTSQNKIEVKFRNSSDSAVISLDEALEALK